MAKKTLKYKQTKRHHFDDVLTTGAQYEVDNTLCCAADADDDDVSRYDPGTQPR